MVTLRRTSAIRGSAVPGTSARIDPEMSTATTSVGAPVLGVRRGEDVVDVVRAEHVEGRGGDGRQLAVGRDLRSGAVRSAQPGLGERPVGRGAAERGPEGVERLRPAGVGGRRGGGEPAVAQLRRVVGRGDDRAPGGGGAAQLALGHEPDLARAGRASRGASAATMRVRGNATDSASAEASMPSASHTASPTAPSASRPSPLPPGSWATSRTVDPGAVTSSASALQPPPARVICAAVAASVTK